MVLDWGEEQLELVMEVERDIGTSPKQELVQLQSKLPMLHPQEVSSQSQGSPKLRATQHQLGQYQNCRHLCLCVLMMFVFPWHVQLTIRFHYHSSK